jgi:hypothetical protein
VREVRKCAECSEKTYRVHFIDLSIDGRVVLKCLKKLVVKAWTGFNGLTYV